MFRWAAAAAQQRMPRKEMQGPPNINDMLNNMNSEQKR